MLTISSLSALVEAQRLLDQQKAPEAPLPAPTPTLSRQARRKAERDRHKAERKKKP